MMYMWSSLRTTGAIIARLLSCSQAKRLFNYPKLDNLFFKSSDLLLGIIALAAPQLIVQNTYLD